MKKLLLLVTMVILFSVTASALHLVTYDNYSDGLVDPNRWDNDTGLPFVTELANTYIRVDFENGQSHYFGSNNFLTVADIHTFINNISFFGEVQYSNTNFVGGGTCRARIWVFGNMIVQITRTCGGSAGSDSSIWDFQYNTTSEQFQVFDDGAFNSTISIIDNHINGTARSEATGGTGGIFSRIHEINYTLRRTTAPNLTTPLDGNKISQDLVTFNTTITTPTSGGISFQLQNATLFVWNSSHDVVVQDMVAGLSGTNTSIEWDIASANFSLGDHQWNILACVKFNENCGMADVNSTFSFGIMELGQEFNQTVIETSLQAFSLNVSVAVGTSVQAASLIYNGTEHTGATKTNTAGDNWTLTKAINIPQIPIGSASQNLSFFWNVTLADETTGDTINLVTSSNNQTVNELVFNVCGVDNADDPVLNFTLFNEITNTEINGADNATTFQATFNIGAQQSSLNKNFSISNISVAQSRFDFCTSEPTNTFFADMNAFYTAVDFSDSNHFLVGAALDGNNTNEISLFLLPETDAVQFFITVRRTLVPVEGATVQIAKFFVGEGSFQTVEIDQTDASGKISANLELDKEYRFTVIEDGVVTGIFERTSICEQAPCEISLSLESDATDIFDDFDAAFADDVVYNLSYNPLTQIVLFQFVDTTGLATSFTMNVTQQFTNQTNVHIFSQTVFTSSGSMTFNATNLSNGDYRVDVFISRSPNELIDFLLFIINVFTETFGLAGFALAFILILTIIFGIALSPAFLVISVPVALTLVRNMGFIFISGITLTAIYIIAIIVVLLMRK